ncbi:MAG TPA: hypothetical protein VGF40_10785 [Thermoanaerobaculia bacterium]
MKRIFALSLIALLAALGIACASSPAPSPRRDLGAGFRWSMYGPDYEPAPEYWAMVGFDMARRFPGSHPETIWIVSRMDGEGTLVNFPVETTDPYIRGTAADGNEAMLRLFDRLGFRVWLQVEPAQADVEGLIDLVLTRYAHHPSVVGLGIDVEWYKSTEKPEGHAVSDEVAAAWLAAVRRHDPGYRLFLKHWEQGKLPPTLRDGLVFVDDSQILPSLEAMVAEFERWGKHFAPAPVAFQFGYDSDRPWWGRLSDPPSAIGNAILARVPNAAGLYWVDFTVLEVFPPGRE